jgi:hypothetical protein
VLVAGPSLYTGLASCEAILKVVGIE